MIQNLKLHEVHPNKENPRIIKDDKFKKLVQSIRDFPDMLNKRPLVLNKDHMILGGNMRYKAAIEAGLKEIPCIVADWDEEQQKEFTIKDNLSMGEWDFDILANEWNVDDLTEWGLDFPQPLDYSDQNKEIGESLLGDTTVVSFTYPHETYLELIGLLNKARDEEMCDSNEQFLEKILKRYV